MLSVIPLQNPPSEPQLPLDPDDNVVPPLLEDQIWIRRHPASNIPSGFFESLARKSSHSAVNTHFRVLPTYFPFRNMGDFCQAEVFSKFGATDEQIDWQLGLETTKVSLKDAKEYHETLAREIRLSGEVSQRTNLLDQTHNDDTMWSLSLGRLSLNSKDIIMNISSIFCQFFRCSQTLLPTLR